MAAHPFGPIETFLLRGYKKIRFDPQRVRITIKPKRLKSVRFQNIPYWFLHMSTKATFELERTAIVNSSDSTCETTNQISKLDLLRRGLGYRITFTMPAD